MEFNGACVEYDEEAFSEDVNLKTVTSAFLENSNFGRSLRARFAYSLVEFLYDYSVLLFKTKSPIEKAFVEAIFEVAPMHGLPVSEGGGYNCEQILGNAQFPTAGLYVFPQFKIELLKTYYVDFLLVAHDPLDRSKLRKLIVECDGHDFHEKTKEQARKDKSRDRDLIANGFSVFRFTGSEIHKDPKECAEQVAGFMSRLIHG